MGECARCGAFTDNPASGDYQYCDECLDTFDRIRRNGVVVRRIDDRYRVLVTAPSKYESGFEEAQVDALARGKFVADDLGVDALFENQASGSQWELEEYLRAHPEIQTEVTQRLERVPDEPGPGILEQIKRFFR